MSVMVSGLAGVEDAGQGAEGFVGDLDVDGGLLAGFVPRPAALLLSSRWSPAPGRLPLMVARRAGRRAGKEAAFALRDIIVHMGQDSAGVAGYRPWGRGPCLGRAGVPAA